jgi:DNA-binding NarL/FixJ family response regulator
VLLAENIWRFYDGMRVSLEALGYGVLPQARTIQEARHALDDAGPQIAILDIYLDDNRNQPQPFIEFLNETVRDHPETTVLVHSLEDYLTPQLASAILRVGVSYLVKDAIESDETLQQAIEFARNGGAVYSRHVIQHFDEIVRDPVEASLTPQMWHVAELFAEDLTQAEIAREMKRSEARISQLADKIVERLKLRSHGDIGAWYLTHNPR